MAINNSNVGNRGFLSDEINEDGLYPIWGVAIGNNDITRGHLSKETKLWRPSVLEEAAETLEGGSIVVDHENQKAREVVGEITDSMYDDEMGVIFRGLMDDSELAQKIDHEWLEVSPRIIHSKDHEEIKGVKIPEYIEEFQNLSVVNQGAAGSNEIHLGEPEELSVEELQESFEEDISAEFQLPLDSKEVEELQEEINFARWMYDNPEGAEGASQRFGCSGYHEREVNGQIWYMPCKDRDNFIENVKEEIEDMSEAEELQLSEARTPSYDDTETKSWGDIPADTLSYWTDALDYDAEQVDDLTQDQKNEIAQHTLLGDPQADNVRELRFFPVVNARTEDLNRGALEAVRGGRGQEADISESAWESAASEAGRLLEEEFGSDVPDVEELATHDKDSEEMRRIASQLASQTAMTKSESLSLVRSFTPSGFADIGILAKAISNALGVDRDRMERVMDKMSEQSSVIELQEGEELSSLANSVSSHEGFEDVDADDVMSAFDDLRESSETEQTNDSGSLLNKIV
jgi:hypothetical protein